jgi:hypothetical protein
MNMTVRVLSCDLLYGMRTYTALTLSHCYDSVHPHRLDLERELDDRNPSGKVGRVTFEASGACQQLLKHVSS